MAHVTRLNGHSARPSLEIHTCIIKLLRLRSAHPASAGPQSSPAWNSLGSASHTHTFHLGIQIFQRLGGAGFATALGFGVALGPRTLGRLRRLWCHDIGVSRVDHDLNLERTLCICKSNSGYILPSIRRLLYCEYARLASSARWN